MDPDLDPDGYTFRSVDLDPYSECGQIKGFEIVQQAIIFFFVRGRNTSKSQSKDNFDMRILFYQIDDTHLLFLIAVAFLLLTILPI